MKLLDRFTCYLKDRMQLWLMRQEIRAIMKRHMHNTQHNIFAEGATTFKQSGTGYTGTLQDIYAVQKQAAHAGELLSKPVSPEVMQRDQYTTEMQPVGSAYKAPSARTILSTEGSRNTTGLGELTEIYDRLVQDALRIEEDNPEA